MTTRKWKSPTQVALEFEVTDRTVRRWCELGRVPALQMPSGRWRIYPSRKEMAEALADAETMVAA